MKRIFAILLFLCCTVCICAGCQSSEKVSENEKRIHQQDIQALSEIRIAFAKAIYDEEYSGITGIITYTGRTINVRQGEENITGYKSLKDFFDEVCLILNGSTDDYSYRLKSKLAGSDTQLIIEFKNGDVYGKIISSKYGTEYLQDRKEW